MSSVHPHVAQGRDIDHELLKRLATIVIGWSNVEAILAEFLTYLLRADPGAMYVFNQTVSSGTQLKWIRHLADARFTNENTRNGLAKLFERIQDAAADRNGYVHGLWRVGETDKTSATVQTIKVERKDAPIREELVTAPDLDELIGEIEDIAQELYQIGVDLNFIRF